MKINDLENDDKIQVIVIGKKTIIRPYPDSVNQEPHAVDRRILYNQIYTDGIIKNESDEEIKFVSDLINDNQNNKEEGLYIKTKSISVKDYNFIIDFIIENKIVPSIKYLNVYLKNIKDKESLKEAKRIIKMVKKDFNKTRYLLNENTISNQVLKRVKSYKLK